MAPAPLGPERVNEGAGSTGHTVAFCVRLCDGQHFPLEQMAAVTPVETCRAICPGSQTKVFFGAEIDAAPRRAMARIISISPPPSFIASNYVANCTCNGRDAFGLVPLDVKTDPTLRPGDVVSTKEGLETYGGKSGKSPAFTPVTPEALGPQLNSVATPQNAPPAGNPPHR